MPFQIAKLQGKFLFFRVLPSEPNQQDHQISGFQLG